MKKIGACSVAFAIFALVIAKSVSADGISFEEWQKIEASLRPAVMVDEEEQYFEIEPIFDDVQSVVGYQVPTQTLEFQHGDSIRSENGFLSFFDPVITAAIGVVDVGTPSSFAVAVASPLAPPITVPAVGLLSIAGSFADGASDGGSATPWLTPRIAQATVEGTGVADAGAGTAFASPIDTYGPFSVPYNFDCTTLGDGQCDSFDLQISFTGSGGNDAFSFTARHEINPIPEPSTFLFSTIAYLMLGFMNWRKCRGA